jgi:Cys-tRNA(Pro)/Cys-tRNA(Cys) deacylase
MTPAIRLAESAGISCVLHEYEHDPDADSFGLEAAEKLGVPAERLFKTLIARLDGKELVMALVPAADRLDVKKLAAATGAKKADLAEPAAAERATGYVVGGISPLGGRKKLRTIIDVSILELPRVFVSAGRRGLQMELAVADLLRLTGATTAAISVAR